MESLTDVSMERERELLADAAMTNWPKTRNPQIIEVGQRLLVIKMAVKLVV